LKRLLENRAKQNEKGAIIAEATIVLPMFIFAIFIILSIVEICYMQSKMSVALNSAAKEMSQYAYLYTTLGLDESLSGEGGKSSEFMDSFSEVLAKVAGVSDMVAMDEVTELFETGSEVAAGDSLAEYMKDGVGMALAKQLVKKNLVSYKNDTAESFLRRNGVVGGLDGLSFVYTSFLTNETQDEVDIVVTYKIRVLNFFNNDLELRFLQRATSKVWGQGVSLVSSEGGNSTADSSTGIWDENSLSRGKQIVSNEKKNYTYTSDKNGFHAYNKEKNEYVRIISINTFDSSYSDSANGEKAINNAMKSAFNSLYSGVDKVGTSVTLKDSSGKDATVSTPKDGRVYKIVVVVPDNADITQVQNIAKAFEKERKELGDEVSIEVKTGYGSVTQSSEGSGT